MTTWYVSPTGSDSGPGTAANPWASVAHALDTLAAGDTVKVNDGVYSPWFNDQTRPWLNLSKPCTLQSVNPRGAVLDGLLQCHSVFNFLASGNQVTLQDFLIKRGAHGGVWANALSAQGVTLRGLEICNISNQPDSSNKGNCGVYSDGAAILVVDGCNLHDIGRSTATDPGNAFDHCIYSHGNITVTNCTFSNLLQGWAIQTADGCVLYVRNCAFNGPVLYNGAGGLKNGQIELWGAILSADVSSNIFTNPRGVALDVSSAGFSCPTFKSGNNSVTGGATLGGPAGQQPSGATGPQGPQTVQPPPSGLTITVNGVVMPPPVTIVIK